MSDPVGRLACTASLRRQVAVEQRLECSVEVGIVGSEHIPRQPQRLCTRPLPRVQFLDGRQEPSEWLCRQPGARPAAPHHSCHAAGYARGTVCAPLQTARAVGLWLEESRQLSSHGPHSILHLSQRDTGMTSSWQRISDAAGGKT